MLTRSWAVALRSITRTRSRAAVVAPRSAPRRTRTPRTPRQPVAAAVGAAAAAATKSIRFRPRPLRHARSGRFLWLHMLLAGHAASTPEPAVAQNFPLDLLPSYPQMFGLLLLIIRRS